MSGSYELVENHQVASVLKKEIRRKLNDLSRYSDDDGELSDYIMIMIANKRNKYQMQDDLSLFLGSATETFVDWLHTTLERSKSDGSASSAKITTTNATSGETKLGTKRKHSDDVSTGRDEKKKSKGDSCQDNSNVLELVLTEEIDTDLVQGDEKMTNSRRGDDDDEEDDNDDDDDQDYEGNQEDRQNEQQNTREKRETKNERCKFWPSCKLGDKCPYHHPTKPCLLFPNCRFGDQCLYKHPMCKFDTGCMNRHCPFAHSIGTQRVTHPPFRGIPAPKMPPSRCKFGHNCLNSNCLFLHPRLEPCRFGSNCLLDTCLFTHPGDKKKAEDKKNEPVDSKETVSTFKWTARSVEHNNKE